MRLALAVLAALVASGCTNKNGEVDPLIPNRLTGRIVEVMSLTTLVGAEIGSIISDPPEGFQPCPTVTRDGDGWTISYGAAGCVPDSGLTLDTMLGVVDVTVSQGAGLFLGTFTWMGVAGSTLSGAITGDTSVAGDLIQADLDLSEVSWARGADTLSLDAFVEITGTRDDVSLFVDGATFVGVDPPSSIVDVDDAVTPRDALGGCFVPSGGAMTIARDGGRADLTFSPDAHDSGNITARYNDREPATVAPCGG